MEVEYNDPVVQEQGDIQNCNHYRGIKLLKHTMKVWERVIEMRMRKGMVISKNAATPVSDPSKMAAFGECNKHPLLYLKSRAT